MSTGPWQRDPLMGHPKALVDRVDDDFQNDEGWLDLERIFPRQDLDLTDVRSIAAVVGVGARYLANSILTHPGCPIHLEERRMFDHDTGAYLFTAYGTCVSSAQAGGRMWRELMAANRTLSLRPGRADFGTSLPRFTGLIR